jgi:hypothetical protein
MVRCVQSRPASIVFSVLRLIAVQNILCWLACFVHNGPPSLKFQYSLSISSLGLSSLWSVLMSLWSVGCTGCNLSRVHRTVHNKPTDIDAHGALMFSPPTFSPSDNSTHTVGPSDNWSLEHFDPHLFVPCIV